MHRTHGDSRFTWHHNVTATDLVTEMTVIEISNIMEATLHACASHDIDHKNTRQEPLQ